MYDVANIEKAARGFSQAAGWLQEYAKADPGRPLVILGRDAWPLVPLLREQQVPVQYFLFSRLQKHDAATAERWRAEVPTQAVVIDTGYAGSIIDAIRHNIDPSVDGALLSSSGEYPQILPQSWQHADIVETIERMPKLVGRISTYRGEKPVMAREQGEDLGDIDRRYGHTKAVNLELLLACGLSPLTAAQYSGFTGITLKERLGLPPAKMRAHLRRCEREHRRAATPLKSALAAAVEYGEFATWHYLAPRSDKEGMKVLREAVAGAAVAWQELELLRADIEEEELYGGPARKLREKYARRHERWMYRASNLQRAFYDYQPDGYYAYWRTPTVNDIKEGIIPDRGRGYGYSPIVE